MPGTPVYCAHEVNPQLEEWPRASTTAMAAYVGPVVSRYLDELEDVLKGLGFRGALQLMRSDGGVATPRSVRQNPAHMLTSGLAGGVTAAVDLCRNWGSPTRSRSTSGARPPISRRSPAPLRARAQAA